MHKAIAHPIILLTALLSLAACEREQKVAALPPAPAAPAPAAAQPELWSIEVAQEGKPASRVEICADKAVREGFARPTPEVNGQPCLPTKPPLADDASYSARCRADGSLYSVNSGTTGDLNRDFTVEMNVTRQGATQPTYEQTRRYRLVGPCPTGWRIGESAAPGDKDLLDTITGARRPMPSGG